MMQFYRVTRTCSVMVGRIRVDRDPPPRDPEHPQRIATSHIFCGQVHWEIRAIKEVCGEDAVEVIATSRVKDFLPAIIKPARNGKDLKTQLLELRQIKPNGIATRSAMLSASGAMTKEIFRIVLINGTGTMLGDNMVGAGVFHRLQDNFSREGLELRITVVLGANAALGADSLWLRWPWVEAVHACGVSLMSLQDFDAMLDFSSLLRMEGYSNENFFDFYIDHFGANRDDFDTCNRNPAVRIKRLALNETKQFLAQSIHTTNTQINHGQPAKLFLLQSRASTPARSMPNDFVERLLLHLFHSKRGQRIFVLMFEPPSEGLEAFRRQIINCEQFSRHAVDRFFSLIFCADHILTVDSLALHVAMGLGKRGTAFFSLSPPEIRLRYASQILNLLIPGASNLPYWQRHKADDAWPKWESTYEKAWGELMLDSHHFEG